MSHSRIYVPPVNKKNEIYCEWYHDLLLSHYDYKVLIWISLLIWATYIVYEVTNICDELLAAEFCVVIAIVLSVGTSFSASVLVLLIYIP